MHLFNQHILQSRNYSKNMENYCPSKTPMETRSSSDPDSTSECIIGKKSFFCACRKSYLMLSTRPDLNFSINYLNRFLQVVLQKYTGHLKRI